LHNSVDELRSGVKYRLDLQRNAREYLWPALGITALLGLAAGFAFTGLFTRR
jgi:tetrahydromethanopterin S-methyltransferase subunit F